MQINDRGAEIDLLVTREEFFLIQSLISEAVETGDDRDFQTRVGVTKDEVRTLLESFPDLPLDGC